MPISKEMLTQAVNNGWIEAPPSSQSISYVVPRSSASILLANGAGVWALYPLAERANNAGWTSPRTIVRDTLAFFLISLCCRWSEQMRSLHSEGSD